MHPILSAKTQSPSKAAKHAAAAKVILRSQYGTVRVYTRRHIGDCSFVQPDQQSCSCPKWLYAKPAQGAKQYIAAKTPSFAEACEIAQKLLKSFDPEIAEIRQEKKLTLGAPIADAVDQYIAALEQRHRSPTYLRANIRPTLAFSARRTSEKGLRPGRQRSIPSLLDFMAPRVTCLGEITPRLLADWLRTWKAADITAARRRIGVHAFFNWCVRNGLVDKMPEMGDPISVKRGNRCGSFTDDEFGKITAAIEFLPRNYEHGRGASISQASFTARLRAFCELGRWGGMAISDIVSFTPAQQLTSDDLLVYRRKKTDEIATVLLPHDVARRLRSLPADDYFSATQPLLEIGNDVEVSTWNWRRRFQSLCATAGIREIKTELGTTKKPHPHMLRDTCAISAISRGVSLENVSKMLGHTTVEMTQKSYLFWIKSRVDHCIADQRAAFAQLEKKEAGRAGGVEPRSGGAAHLDRRPITATVTRRGASIQ